MDCAVLNAPFFWCFRGQIELASADPKLVHHDIGRKKGKKKTDTMDAHFQQQRETVSQISLKTRFHSFAHLDQKSQHVKIGL